VAPLTNGTRFDPSIDELAKIKAPESVLRVKRNEKDSFGRTDIYKKTHDTSSDCSGADHEVHSDMHSCESLVALLTWVPVIGVWEMMVPKEDFRVDSLSNSYRTHDIVSASMWIQDGILSALETFEWIEH
jgi:hypothetical protein